MTWHGYEHRRQRPDMPLTASAPSIPLFGRSPTMPRSARAEMRASASAASEMAVLLARRHSSPERAELTPRALHVLD